MQATAYTLQVGHSHCNDLTGDANALTGPEQELAHQQPDMDQRISGNLPLSAEFFLTDRFWENGVIHFIYVPSGDITRLPKGQSKPLIKSHDGLG